MEIEAFQRGVWLGLVGGILAWSGAARAEPPSEQQKDEIRRQIRDYWRYRTEEDERRWGTTGPIYFWSPGPIFSFEGGSLTWVGAELSTMYFFKNERRDFWARETTWLGVGGFAQAQVDRGGTTGRVAFGAQASYGLLGVEVGPAVRGGTDGHATAATLHVAGFLSFGGLHVALRRDFPFARLGAGSAQEPINSVVLGIKLPIFNNHVEANHAISGRPLTIAQRGVIASLRRAEGWG